MDYRTNLKRKRRIMSVLAGKGLSITSLSYRMGVSQPYLSDVISGKKPYRSCEVKIARILQLPVDYLFPPQEVQVKTWWEK